MRKFSESLARFIKRRPWWLVVVAVVLAAALAPGVTMLESETGFNSLVSPDSKLWQDSQHYQEQFGGEPITVSLMGEMKDIFSSDNLAVLSDFEQRIISDERYRAIIGPITILQTAIVEAEKASQALMEQVSVAQEEAAAAARQAAAAMGLDEVQQEVAAQQAREDVRQMFLPQIEQLLQIGEPSLENQAFIETVIYDAEGDINDAMQSFVPDDKHVLILVTPEGNMDQETAVKAADDIEAFFSDNPLNSISVTVIADARLIDSISVSMTRNMAILLGLSVAAMVLILIIIFRVRLRLLSLLMVGVGALATFGIMGYASVDVTMATMAVLPILIGLGIDYSIQFQNRYQEEIIRSRSVGEAIVTSVSRIFPAVGIALLATIIGFITLYISEVPMIRDFGMVLAVGIVLSYIAGLFLLNGILYLGDRGTPVARLQKAASVASGRIERVLSRVAGLAIRHTLPIFLIALVFAIGGGVVDQWLPVNTNYEELMPQTITELKELRELRQIIGSGGDIRFMVEADDVTSTEVLGWMKDYQEEALALHPELISVSSPASLVAGVAGGVIPDQGQIEQILAGIPKVYLEQVISEGGNIASISFVIEYISLEETNDLIKAIEGGTQPPEGVQVSPVGTLALGASTVDAVVGTRFTMNLICLGAVFAILMLIYRNISRPIFAIIAVGAVIAWSSLDMYLIGIPLNPLTAVLGIIIIGICTEFMVLLMGRYEEERRLGLQPGEAMVTALTKIGRAIVTTAMTTLGGFGVLIASDFV
ncbi:MAG TPA: RND family transporter, partial [Dehalococcoidia bacterium]|nr:RND family transporter [Dehalococcoidia bacterium]